MRCPPNMPVWRVTERCGSRVTGALFSACSAGCAAACVEAIAANSSAALIPMPIAAPFISHRYRADRGGIARSGDAISRP
jgi:hypothetical protein